MPNTGIFRSLLNRFGGTTPEMLNRVLAPYRLKLSSIHIDADRKGAKFEASVPADVWTDLEPGTTGKVVPLDHVERGAPWREIIKARVLTYKPGVITGELYFVPPKRLEQALTEVRVGDYLEIDPFGVTSKIESALCEASFFTLCQQAGFSATRMPENLAMHLGTQNYFDFRLERNGRIYRVELKSLWGTDTTKARLIHTVSKPGGGGKNSARTDRQEWKTSSCRFKDQDIFAVSMWLRTGRITDFAFALSKSNLENKEWGLPPASKHIDHVTQNPSIPDPPSQPWTSDLIRICELHDAPALRRGKPRKSPPS